VIVNGVDTALCRPNAVRSTSPERETRLRILFVGRFQKQKNLELLFRQLAHLPENTFELHLAGDGPEKERLENLSRELKIAAAIKWHGWLSRSELSDVYQSADLLVHPSLYEGMPNVVLEGMACGLPVVASKVAGHDEVVVHGETGFLFSLEKPSELLSAVKQMYDFDLRQRMGARGRARAVAEFSWRKAAEAYVALFR
jgi:glycosyltransferase involved in cell wall biosynthesis